MSARQPRGNLPRISIVTPSLNQGEFLEDCIQSILDQGYPDLEYIIMDGGSTDGSVEIIRKYELHLSYWQSRPDDGHYAAVADGFSRTTGDIMAWLNADDKYCPLALFKAAYVFDNLPDVSWITARPLQWSAHGRVDEICAERIVYSRERMVLRRQFQTPFIQQESTFWRRALWDRANRGPRADLQLAGDFELWVRFFRFAQLQFVDTLLGGNRRHSKQRSVRFMNIYLDEAANVLDEEQRLPEPACPSSELPPLTLDQGQLRAFLVKAGAPTALIDADEFVSDLVARLIRLTADHQSQVEAGHRAAAALIESETDRAGRLDAIHSLESLLAESESDRAARLEAMDRLSALLQVSEADRAARLQVIEALEAQLEQQRGDSERARQEADSLRAQLANQQVLVREHERRLRDFDVKHRQLESTIHALERSIPGRFARALSRLVGSRSRQGRGT